MTDRRCPRFVVALVGVIVALSMSEGAAHAAAPIAPMTVAVSLEGDGPRWHLDAWAGSLRYHLDRASQLRVVEADVPSGCAPRPSCLLDAWAGSADLLAVGNAHGDGLALSLWSVSGHRRLSQVRVDTDRGSPDEQLRRAAVALSRPLQLATRPVTAPDEAEAATVRSASSLIIDVLGALLALLLVAVAGERRPTVAVLAAAFGALALLRGHPAGDLVVGALWGWWLVDVLPSLVAPAPRLDRAPGRLLARAVGALLSESALRLVGTLLFDGVVLLAVALLARLLGLSWRETVTGPALLAALLCRQALKTLPRRLAGALDHELEARRQASAGYHRAVMRTLRAHFRRHGLDEALERLENVSILVVDGDDVVGYGDRAQVRLRVGRELLSAAGVKPAADRHVSLRVDARWSAGLIVPRPPSSSAAASPLGVGDAAYEPRRARRFLDRSAEVRGYQAPLDGWVLPRRGEARPLLADTAADHAIVDALVRAPLLRFGRPGVDDDHDDSDPGHRDFLVGALLREILRVQCASPLNGPTVARPLPSGPHLGAGAGARRSGRQPAGGLPRSARGAPPRSRRADAGPGASTLTSRRTDGARQRPAAHAALPRCAGGAQHARGLPLLTARRPPPGPARSTPRRRVCSCASPVGVARHRRRGGGRTRRRHRRRRSLSPALRSAHGRRAGAPHLTIAGRRP
jgi:hypothetical protein